MHIDYAKEVVEYHEDNYEDHNMTIMTSLAPETEVMKVAESLGDEKISSICSTMREAEKSRYRKITDKQRYAVAKALLDNFGTARAVLAKSFNTTEEEMFGKPDEVAEGVEIHPTLNIGFGLLSDFVADSSVQKKGVTYAATKAAIRATNLRKFKTFPVVIEGRGLVVVTQDEAQLLGLPEQEAEWFQRAVSDEDLGAVAKNVRGIISGRG